MDIRHNILNEEQYFPEMFASFEEREYGVLYYNEKNKESHDSNHAVLHPEKILDFEKTIIDIKKFYKSKHIVPIIYQPFSRGYFSGYRRALEANGYEIRHDGLCGFMVLAEPNTIKAQRSLDITRLTAWDERIASDVYIPSNEEYEIERERDSIKKSQYYLFAGYQRETLAALLSLHTSPKNRCTRFDYIIVSKEHRGKNYGQEMLGYAVDYARENGFENCYQWPANSHSEYLCVKAGFRKLFEEESAQAVCRI